MYVVDSVTFARLEPYIQIERQTDAEEEDRRIRRRPVASTTLEPDVTRALNLDSSDTLDLMNPRGIGRAYARRIVSYRELLGGYHNVEQLKEVYGIPADLVESLRENLLIDSIAIRKFSINMVPYHELRQHPYISEYQAKAIVYYRETVGNLKSIDELLRNNLLDSASFRRVKPYIKD